MKDNEERKRLKGIINKIKPRNRNHTQNGRRRQDRGAAYEDMDNLFNVEGMVGDMKKSKAPAKAGRNEQDFSDDPRHAQR